MRRPPLLDVTLALALAAWGVLEAVLLAGEGTAPTRIAWALLFTVPLVWRRTAPVAVALLIAAALALRTLVVDGGPAEEGAMPFPALLLATYTVALLGRTLPAAIVGGAAAYAALMIAVFTNYYSGDAEPADGAVLSFFVFAAWAGGYVVRQRTQRGERQTEAALSAERARISRELHDIIGHSMSVIALQAGAAEQTVRRDPERATEHLRAVQRTAREALAEMRRLMGVLREDEADYAPQPGLAGLPALIADARRAGLDVDVVEEGARPALPPGLDLAAYRIVQEALTNARKHAGAPRAHVRLRYGVEGVEVEVRNERGTGATGEPGGAGLAGMRERVRMFDGTLDAGPDPGGGFHVRARLPLEAA